MLSASFIHFFGEFEKLLALIVRGRDARPHDAVIGKLAVFVGLGHGAPPLAVQAGAQPVSQSPTPQGSPVGDAQVCASLTTIAKRLIAIPGWRAERLGQGSFGSSAEMLRTFK